MNVELFSSLKKIPPHGKMGSLKREKIKNHKATSDLMVSTGVSQSQNYSAWLATKSALMEGSLWL